ncbi:hypothetical protein KMD50_gp49 [Lactococcus phage PLgW-1]|uniref:Uncharacterized protein n=3 Tax=Uwajimavirus PLgW1 TaxID=2845441 RepID=A0A2Z2P3L7_9CAUD|nr:hypothetical protein KMD50_gp49 [Lactococcus phage PLgW-1]ARQ94860.1 hypothetical protein PLgW1_49 [Lactococcus phage PLgW-1]ASJ80032.1 hypothetical protein [Lactococcus phage PLgY-16]ASJ80085.1 hypothetical protein [Lactococcus phage PLgY-30]
MKKKAFYIVYNKDDEFLALGTAEEIGCQFDLTPLQVRQKACDFKRREHAGMINRYPIRIFGVGRMDVE